MPELPEVETIVRTLAPQVLERRIADAAALHPRVLQAGADLLPRLRGGRVLRLSRRGKLLLMHVRPGPVQAAALGASELILAFHLKMTGRFFVHPEGTAPLKHTRLVIDLEGAGRLFFDDMRTFGYCRIMLPHELAQWPFWAALGPEPLDMPAKALAAHFARVFAGRRAAIKAVLLNQEVVAGVGNIYADEALFQAGINPARRAADVPRQRLSALATALQAILRRAIEECGSSIRDYRDALGNAGAFQNAFAVYGRKGELCLSCGAPLEFCRIAGRATVFCPRCQA